MSKPVYLDYNATAPVRPEVAEAVARALVEPGNPSSVHGFGRAARQMIEDAREAVAALVGADPAGVIFTGSGTEANNLALRGSGRRRVLVSAIEHESVLRAVPDAVQVPVRSDGRISLTHLASLLAREDEPAVLSLMFANNETGVIQPVAEAAALARGAGALVHCDAVQAAGRLPIDTASLGVDLLTLSAHKLGGPQGVGALVTTANLPISPLIRGGGQERSRRAGTENTAGIAGFGVAATLARSALQNTASLTALRDDLEARALVAVPDAQVHGAAAPRLCNTTCIGVPDVAAELQVMALDLAGIAVSAGAACSSGKVTPSHVLQAMQLGEVAAANAIRVSLGWASEAADVDRFVHAWTQAIAQARHTQAAAVAVTAA